MFLPPPYAIDIGDRTVKIAQWTPRHLWDRHRAWPRLCVLAEHELSEGLVVNGALTDPTALAASLHRMIARATPWFLRSDFAVLTLPETRTFLTTIAAPPDDDRTAAVRRMVATAIPVNAERAVIAARTVPGAAERLAIAAAPAEVVESYAALLHRAGLTIIACTTEANALARAVARISLQPTPTIILDLGATRTGAVVAVGETVVMSVTIPVSGEQLTVAIAAKLKIEPAAAEQAKRAVRLTQAKTDDPAATALISALSPLVEHVQRLRSFAERHLPASCLPTRITLTGGGAALEGINDFLREQLQLPVDRFELPPPVVIRSSLTATTPTARLATVFGLGLIALDPATALSEPIIA